MFRLIGYQFAGSPFEMFTLLLITQGSFRGSESIDTFTDFWNYFTSVQPFSDVSALDPAKKTMAVYCENSWNLDLGVQQNGNRLEIPEARKTGLRDYLASTKVRVDRPRGPPPQRGQVEIEAINIWPEQGRVGHFGSLVAVLVKGDTPGELYEITASPRYPVPLVAVVVTGPRWPQVVVRGVAQTIAHLADEYELPGDEYLRAPNVLIEPRPNVIVVSEAQRELLKIGWAQNLIDFPRQWGVNKKTELKFHEHEGSAPNVDTSKRPNGRVQLVEGGAGYRRNVLRCDFDCLMRRKPYSAELPIQTGGLEFCRACWGALREAVNNYRSYDLRRRRILLDSQLPLCDMVRWKSYEPIAVPVDLITSAGRPPQWACRVELDTTRGLVLRNIQLKNRPDPFQAAQDVFKSVEFGNLIVKFAGEAERHLSVTEAYANQVALPVLQIMRDSTDGQFLAGVRLNLTWHLHDRWTMDVVMSVVFKDKAHDFDPGGAALANKVFPQLSMRYRRPPKTVRGKLPKVEWLKGFVKVVANNVFPTSMALHDDLRPFANGTLQTMLLIDSNASDNDNEYAWDKLHVSAFLGDLLTENDIPEWGLWSAKWKSGRKLAGVAPTQVLPSTGATARRGHLTRGLPVLPHWSWLFDYATPVVGGIKKFVAVYRKGEMTPKGQDGGVAREATFKWPTPADLASGMVPKKDYEMTVRKAGRQGAYDNVHVHPSMGKHHERDIIPAPFCGELCMHLHWRWGTVALAGAINRPLFLGWGNGRLEQGAHTAPGAPLVPPNQHVEVVVDTRSSGHSVTYEVTAHSPDLGAYQVFLEQGIGIAYTYGGLTPKQVSLLAAGVEVIDPTDVRDKTAELDNVRKNDPAKYDRMVRNTFHAIYDRIRWYVIERDDFVGPPPQLKGDFVVQQVPDVSGAPADLEEL